MADTCQSNTNTGNTVTQGAVTATNLNPVFLGATGEQLNMGSMGYENFEYLVYTNQSLIAAPVQPKVGVYALIPITGFALQCLPYIPALASTTGYPYFTENGGPETTGVYGNTLTFTEFKLVGSPVTIGTLTLPNSPHNGPYVNTASVKLANPYTPTSGSVIGISEPSVPGVYSYQNCLVSAVLQ